MAGEPLTAAGRALLAYEVGAGNEEMIERYGHHWDAAAPILAIEAEALAAARERIEAMFGWEKRSADSISRATVLSFLAAPSDAPEKP